MIYTKDLKTKIVEDLSKEAVSMDEFKRQLTKACIEEEIFDECDTVDDEDCICYIGSLVGCDRTVKDNTVIYDLENCDPSEENSLDSFFEINGFPFLGLCLGGDWEHSLYGVLYTKKSTPGKFYLYIPLRGNTFNPDFMTAFGSEEERYSNTINPDDDALKDAGLDFSVINNTNTLGENIKALADSYKKKTGKDFLDFLSLDNFDDDDIEEWYKKHNELEGDFEPELDKSLLMKDIEDAFNL